MVAHCDPADVEPLADGTHLLHVGPQKTGSSALQLALLRQRDTLRQYGVVYPGPGARARYAIGAGLGYAVPRGARDRPNAAWEHLLSQVNDPSARIVCVSHEAFARARRPRIVKTVAALGGPRPHVLAVARRFDAVLPSQWQQRVKARLTLSYDEWLKIVLGPPPTQHDPVWNVTWMPHDTVAMVRRWAEVVGADHVTVLVADDADRSRLPTVVERLFGVPAGLLAPGDEVVNRSLSYSEVELLRAVNQHVEDRGYGWKRYHRIVSHGLVPALIGAPVTRTTHRSRRCPPGPGSRWSSAVRRGSRGWPSSACGSSVTRRRCSCPHSPRRVRRSRARCACRSTSPRGRSSGPSTEGCAITG